VNYVGIRAEFMAAGHRFRTDFDTEVILKAYAQCGERCLDRFDGMWALAIWDHSHARLFLARARLGIQPLHHCADRERIVFVSEVKSLIAAGVPPIANGSLLDISLTFEYIPAAHLFFSAVRKLLPGQYLVIAHHHGRAVRRPSADQALQQ
jgi:asparagine synthase (glutamine-hydrolysing)